MTNPKSYRRAMWLIRVGAVVLMLGALVWSVLPIRMMQIDEFVVEDGTPNPSGSSAEQLSLNSSAFDIVLWYVPPPEEQPARPEPVQVLQVTLQLLAITTQPDGSGHQVQCGVIYDPDEDQLHTVALGKTISGYTLSGINNDSVTLRSGNREIRLMLDQGSG